LIKAKSAACCVAIMVIAALSSGCSMHVRQVSPNAAFISQIGLPVYPNAKALRGQEVSNASKLGDVQQIQVMFETSDDLNRVQDFYVKHVPSTARKMVVPLGFTTAIAYQWDIRNTQKQVMIQKIRDMTIIQLQSLTLTRPTSSSQSTQP
jgi:hypothetical protein